MQWLGDSLNVSSPKLLHCKGGVTRYLSLFKLQLFLHFYDLFCQSASLGIHCLFYRDKTDDHVYIDALSLHTGLQNVLYS
jgi:hypothetical protein